MKKINLNQPFKGFDGKEIKNLTVRQALLNCIGATQSDNGEQAVKIVKLGMELNDAKDEFHFGEADEQLLKKAIDVTGVKLYTAIVIAKLTEILEEAVVYSPNKK